MMYSFFMNMAGSQIPMCGNGRQYQVNIQQSPVQLLAVPETGDPGYDARMAEIAQKVNHLFGVLSADLLHHKLAEMGNETKLEVTIFLTDKGLLPGFSAAMDHKERAPTPTRQRRLFGLGMAKSESVAWDYSLPPKPSTAQVRSANAFKPN